MSTSLSRPAHDRADGPLSVLGLARWQVELDGAHDLRLAGDGTGRPGAPLDAVVHAELDTALTARVRDLATAVGVAVPAVLAAAFAVLSGRLGNSRDFLVATAGVANGPDAAHLLPQRVDLSRPVSFADLVLRTQRTANRVTAFGASRAATEDALRRLRDGADVVRCAVAFRATGPLPDDAWREPGGDTDVDLGLAVPGDHAASVLAFAVHYASARHDAATMDRVAVEFATVCRDLVEHPDRDCGNADHHGPRLAGLLARGAGAAAGISRLPLHEVVARHAATRPDAVAVVTAGGRLTYGRLWADATAVADRLAEAGVRHGDTVLVAADRDAHLPVAMLGVLAAGAAYLPLDLDLPTARVDAMLAVARPRAVVAAGRGLPVAHRLGLPVVDATTPAAPNPLAHHPGDVRDVAYVMFTSGSTGEPKGVAVTHLGVATLAENPAYVSVSEVDVVACLAPEFFGAAMLEIWLALLNGATLAMASTSRLSPADLASFVADHGVTVAHLTAGLLGVVADERPDALRGVRHLLAGGDVVTARHVARVVGAVPGIRVSACYGSTETAVLASVTAVTEVRPGQPVPIGHAIPGRETHVLTEDFHLASDGVAGELAVGGDGLARGYHRRPGLTAERFVPHPHVPGARLYRTGDLVRTSAGVTTFLGRNDQQVKIRGFRVEPLEVGRALAEHEAVLECVVRVRSTVDGPILVAYVVLGGAATVAELAAFLRTRLPGYCVPSRLLPLPALPLTKRAKVDGAALDALPLDDVPREAGPDLTPTQELVHRVWSAAFDGKAVAIDADFFELGGHSLTALRAAARLADELRREVPVDLVFAEPTVRRLAAALDRESR